MNYVIENRMGDYYAILDDNYKNATLCVNLSTILKTETLTVRNNVTYNKETSWFLSYDDENLSLNFTIEENTFKQRLDIEKLLESLVYCIKNNRTLNECSYLNDAINELYTDVFFSNTYTLLYSDEKIVRAEIRIKDLEDNILGRASRFILTEKRIKLLEYVGKKLEDNLSTASRIEIVKDDKIIDLGIITINNNIIQDNDIRYYEIDIFFGNCSYGDIYDLKDLRDIEYIPKLPNRYTNPDMMYDYITANNQTEDISKYKASVKSKTILLDINKFIINDFSI